jgi:SAM-dependent methyltransferase
MEPQPASDPYDRVRYPSHAFPQTHPDRLCAIARLHGIPAAPPESCRYLELGCGSGTNLLAMAMLLPDSRFLGIDLAGGPIAEAQRHAQELELGDRLEFRQGDIAGLTSDGAAPAALGEYDYIVAHGVFSWVPEAVRTALLLLIQRHLAPHGVAYISYNAYPGGHLRQLLRQMLRYHVQDLPEEGRIDQGRALVQFVLDAQGGPPAYAPILQAELTHLQKAEPGLIHHDDLAEISQPFHLHEFLALARSHGLQFLAEANLHEMQYRTFPPEVVRTLDQLGIEQREQYIDFLRCRRFRQTLLVRADCPVDRAHPTTHLAALLVAGDVQEEAAAAPSAISASLSAANNSANSQPPAEHEITFVRGQSRMTVRTAIARPLMAALAARWPRTCSCAELLAQLRATLDGAAASEQQALALVLEAIGIGMIDLRASPVPCAERLGSHPRASRFARWQLQQQRAALQADTTAAPAHAAPQPGRGTVITSLRHVTIRTEGALTPVLVDLCDGTRDHAALATGLVAAVAAGRLPPPQGADRDDPRSLREAADRHLGVALAHLQRLALLEA